MKESLDQTFNQIFEHCELNKAAYKYNWHDDFSYINFSEERVLLNKFLFFLEQESGAGMAVPG